MNYKFKEDQLLQLIRQHIDDTYNEHYSEDTEYMMETNLSCPECQSLTIVYLPKEKT